MRKGIRPVVKYCLGVVTLVLLLGFHAFADSDICSRSKEALSFAETYSGFKIKRNVQCKALNKEEYKRISTALIKKDLIFSQLPIEERTLKDIGFIPESYPYARCLIDNLLSSAAAFYSAAYNFFAVPDWGDTPFVILVHEATHALQGQYFNLEVMGDKNFYFSDKSISAAALLEGQAMLVEDLYIKDHPSDALDPNKELALKIADPSCKFPFTLTTLVSAPYDLGVSYISSYHRENGAQGVIKLLGLPPPNEAELLKSRTGLGLGQKLGLSKLSDRRYGKPSFSTHMGIYGITTYLNQRLPGHFTTPLVKNWVGDRLVHYGSKDSGVTTWTTAWNSNEAAQLYYNTLVEFWSRTIKKPLRKEASQVMFEFNNRKVHLLKLNQEVITQTTH